jgi:hypothetical protein
LKFPHTKPILQVGSSHYRNGRRKAVEKTAQLEHHTGSGSCAASASGHDTPALAVLSPGRLQPENLKQPWAALSLRLAALPVEAPRKVILTAAGCAAIIVLLMRQVASLHSSSLPSLEYSMADRRAVIVSVHCDTLTLTAPHPEAPVLYSWSNVLELSTRAKVVNRDSVPPFCQTQALRLRLSPHSGRMQHHQFVQYPQAGSTPSRKRASANSPSRYQARKLLRRTMIQQ